MYSKVVGNTQDSSFSCRLYVVVTYMYTVQSDRPLNEPPPPSQYMTKSLAHPHHPLVGWTPGVNILAYGLAFNSPVSSGPVSRENA